jgi:neural Wiskott-Aldrich syndrome protein
MARQATQTAVPPTDAQTIARSPHLDAALDRAHKFAVAQRHPGVTSEHLLFALSDDPEALGVLGASTISIERLRADISTHLTQLPNDTPANKPVLPTADLLKVLKLAAMAAQQSSRRQIDGAIVLAAMIGDASTPSAGLLRAHGLTFGEVIRVLQRGTPAAAPPVQPGPAQLAPPPPQKAAPPANQQPPVPSGAADPAPAAAAAQQAAAPAAAPARREDASTDEILASVRARLQEAAPPAVARRPEPAPAEAAQPATVKAEPPQAAPSPAAVASETPPAVQPRVESRPAPPPVAPSAPGPVAASPVAAAPKTAEAKPATASLVPDLLPPLAQASRTAPPIAGPLTPDELIAPKPKAPALPPQMPPLPQQAVPQQQSLGKIAAAVPAPALHPAVMPGGTKMPPANAPLHQFANGPQPAREAQRPSSPPPPIPPVTVDMRALANAMPKALRVGQTDVIEISVPRRTLEIPLANGHRWPPLRVSTLRLKAADDRASVELASPETLWIGPSRAHQGADDAIWRWRVSPRTSGRLRLTLAGATRIVGSEGISAEIPFGEETIEIDVARRRSRRGLVGALLFSNLIAVGVLAMVMSGRAAEIGRSAWAGIASLWGG